MMFKSINLSYFFTIVSHPRISNLNNREIYKLFKTWCWILKIKKKEVMLKKSRLVELRANLWKVVPWQGSQCLGLIMNRSDSRLVAINLSGKSWPHLSLTLSSIHNCNRRNSKTQLMSLKENKSWWEKYTMKKTMRARSLSARDFTTKSLMRCRRSRKIR